MVRPKKALCRSNDLISYELFSGDLGPVRRYYSRIVICDTYNNALIDHLLNLFLSATPSTLPGASDIARLHESHIWGSGAWALGAPLEVHIQSRIELKACEFVSPRPQSIESLTETGPEKTLFRTCD